MPVVRWEYAIRVLRLGGKVAEAAQADPIATLDTLGRDGWEAVSPPSEASSHGLRVATTEYVGS